MDSSILAQELEPLKAQIGQVREKVEVLEGDLSLVEAELGTFSTDQQRFNALRDVCNALDRLGELAAIELFWQGLPGDKDGAGHVERLRLRIVQFEGEIRGIEEKRDELKRQINLHLDELDSLHQEESDAYARDERRKEEFLVEREISPIPFRAIIMPWSHGGESERRFRRALTIALLLCLFFGYLIPVIQVPIPDRSAVVVIPERLAMLVKKDPPKPEPIPERPKDQKKGEKKEQLDQEKPKEKEAPEQQAEKAPAPAPNESARKKAESAGVLAFKSNFADLMDEIPVASLGLEARLNKDASMAAGQAQAQRSLVAMQGQGGGSGGIGNAGVSRNVGSGRGGGGSGVGMGGSGTGIAGSGKGIGGVGFARVASTLADLKAEEGRPVSDGLGPARTDEEIQIVFDRYKAALYRIYNKELRKNPTLRGKMLMRISIEPGGDVSMCKVESTDLASPELVAQIIERVQKFNFGPKEGVPKTTILYPIDFLPAG